MRNLASVFFSLLLADHARDPMNSWVKLSKVARIVMISIPFAILVAGAYLLERTVRDRGDGAIFVNARTEIIEYQPSTLDPARWVLRNATIFDKRGEQFVEDGFLQMQSATRVEMKRIGHGVLSLFTEASKPGLIFDGADEFVQELIPPYTIVLEAPSSLVARGEALLFPLIGQITPGRTARYEVGTDTPLLIEGKVELIIRSLVANQFYHVGPFELGLGDRLVLTGSPQKSNGFVTIDEGRGMRVVYSAEGETAQIEKFRTNPVVVENTLWARLYHDDSLSLAWIVFLGIFIIYRFLVRAYIASIQDQCPK